MRSISIALLCIAVSVSAFAATITSVGPMVVARNEHTATLLPDGTVLIAGGVDFAGPGVTYNEEIYDPRSRQFHAIAPMSTTRIGHAAVALRDGRVLVVGGARSDAANSEVFNPTTSTWGNRAVLSGERYELSAALLADGRVLAAGGKRISAGGATLNSAEIYNPTSGGWAFTGFMTQPRANQAAVLLPDGHVLVAGGSQSITAELFDPATGTFTATGNLFVPVTRGVLLPNGKVLLLGLGSLQTYDPASGTFKMSSVHLQTYRGEAVVVRTDGSVVVAGGNIDGSKLSATVLLYSPAADTLTNIGTLTVGRDSPTGTLLPDGTILIAGGYTNPGAQHSAAAEIIDVNARGRSRAVHH